MPSAQQQFEALADRLIVEGADDQTKHDELAAMMDRVGVPVMSLTKYRYDSAIVALFAERGCWLASQEEMAEHRAKQGLPDVRPGQIWEDNDKRSAGRRVWVVEVNFTHATVELVGERGRSWSGLRPGEPARAQPGRQSRIRLDRFRPTSTGYRLVEDAPTRGEPS